MNFKLDWQEVAIGTGLLGIVAYLLWPKHTQPSIPPPGSPQAMGQWEAQTGVAPFQPTVFPAFDASGFRLPDRVQQIEGDGTVAPDYLTRNRPSYAIAPPDYAGIGAMVNWQSAPVDMTVQPPGDFGWGDSQSSNCGCC